MPIIFSLVHALNGLPSEFPLSKLLQRVLSCVGTGSVAFGVEEEEQLCGLLPPSQASTVRTLVEGCTYVFETATFHNLKTAALGQALLEMGVGEDKAVAFGTVWTAASAAVVNRLKAKPLGAPLVLQNSSYRVALNLGSSAATGQRDTTTVLDLEVASGGGGERGGEVLSFEMDRPALEDLLAKMDAVQAQLDSLSS